VRCSEASAGANSAGNEINTTNAAINSNPPQGTRQGATFAHSPRRRPAIAHATRLTGTATAATIAPAVSMPTVTVQKSAGTGVLPGVVWNQV